MHSSHNQRQPSRSPCSTAPRPPRAQQDLGLRRDADVGSPEELIAAGHAPIDLPAPQLLGLMDQLMIMEAAWHCGAMLPQTVYTSLYMLQTDRWAGWCWVACSGTWPWQQHAFPSMFFLKLESESEQLRD